MAWTQPSPSPPWHVYVLLICLVCFCSLKLGESTFSTLVGWGTERCFVVRPHTQGQAFIRGSFECLDEGEEEGIGDALSVTLYDPKDNVVWSSSPGQLEDHFLVPAGGEGSRRHRFCIQNNFGKHRSEQAEHEHQLHHRDKSHHKKKNNGDDDDDDDDVGINAKSDLHVGFAVHVIHGPDLGHTRHTSVKTDDAGANETETHAVDLDDPLTDVLFNYSTVLLDGIMDLVDHLDYMKFREEIHRDRAEAVFAKVSYWTILEALLVVSISLAQVFYLRTFFEQRRSL